MLIDVLTRLAEDTGLHPEQDRNTLVKTLNRAASEMHKRLECNKVYWEITLSVPLNRIVTLPSYIGELRGMRACTSQIIIPQHGMSDPRYCKEDWTYKWNNWRDIGESPVMLNPSSVGPLSVTTTVADGTVVLVSGQTANALRIEEEVTLDALSKNTTNLFGPQIYNIACATDERTSNISIADENGVLLAVLYNTDRYSRYKIIDVSEAPFIPDSAENYLVDVLYKVRLRKLTKDSDAFPATDDFDDAWYWMAMWIYYMPLENKPDNYNTYFGNAITAMSIAKNHAEGNQEKRFTFGRGKYYDIIADTSLQYPWAMTHIDRS